MKKIIASAFLFLPFHYLFSGVSFSKGEVSDTLSDAKKYNYSENIILEDYSGKDNCLWIRIPKTSSDSLLLISGVYSECRVYSDNELIKSSERFISDIPSNDLFNVSGAEGIVFAKILFHKVEKLNIKPEFVSSSALSKLFSTNDIILFSIILLSFFSVVLVLFMKTNKKKIITISFLFSMIYIIAQILANRSFYDYALYFSYFPFISIIVYF